MAFRGVPVRAPADVPGVLRHRYGDTFMVPRWGAAVGERSVDVGWRVVV